MRMRIYNNPRIIAHHHFNPPKTTRSKINCIEFNFETYYTLKIISHVNINFYLWQHTTLATKDYQRPSEAAG